MMGLMGLCTVAMTRSRSLSGPYWPSCPHHTGSAWGNQRGRRLLITFSRRPWCSGTQQLSRVSCSSLGLFHADPHLIHASVVRSLQPAHGIALPGLDVHFINTLPVLVASRHSRESGNP